MKSIGTYVFLFGLGSIVLSFFEMEFRLLSWIDNWGTSVGWGIRIGMMVIGAVLWLLGNKKEEPAS